MEKIIDEIIKFKTRYDYGKIGNGILYEMCKKYPYHNDPAEIVGKVWLIGRSYAVSLERNKKNKNVSDDFYNEIVAPSFLDGFDNLLLDVRKLNGLSKDNIPVIIETHKNVVDFIYKKITGDNKRSFASKYLHFHFPELFFIYDSRTASTINKVIHATGVEKKQYTKHIEKIKKLDKNYAKFFVKCFYLQQFCKKAGLSLTTRHIDSFLVKKANEVIRYKKTRSQI